MKKAGRPFNTCPDIQIATNNDNISQSTFLGSKCKCASKNAIDTEFLVIKKETNVDKFLSEVIENLE